MLENVRNPWICRCSRGLLRHLTNLALALVVAVGLIIPSVPPVAAADAPTLTGFAVCPWGSDDCNPCVPDVPAAIRALRNRGDIMGFHSGATPDPNPSADHWQGVQRTMSGGGRYLVVSRSVETVTKDVSFVVVELATRNDDGLRFRSNRLAPSIDFAFTPPPLEDKVVTIVPHEGSYRHAGGIQLLGNVLAVPFESGNSTDPPSKVVLFDLADPPHPVRLENEILHAVPGGISSEAGTATLGKLADGRFLLIIGRVDANILDFYVSTGSDIRTTAFERFDTWNQDELRTELCDPQVGCTCGEFPFPDCEFGNYQNLSLVHQCDRALYLVGTHKDSSSGEDFVDLYRLDNVPSSNDVAITKVVKRQLVCGYRSENHCDFDAAGGVYVDPEHRLLLYGTEHDNDGPIAGSPICNGQPCSVKFEEFRPVPHGPCTRIEDAWVELYDDTNPDSDRSIIIDFVDRALENYTNYNSIDDFEDRPSHALWCLPEGATHRLWQKRDPCGGDHRDLVGSGQVEEIGDLGGFGDETSCSEWIGGPFADAGDDISAECASQATTPVMLDGTGSVSLNDATLGFSWTAPGITFDDASSATPIGQFPLAPTDVTLTVTEGSLEPHSDSVEVRVVDTTPPRISCPPDAEVVCGQATDPGATGAATSTDICDADPAITFADVATSTNEPLNPVQGIIERTWCSLDDSDNLDECTQDITVLKRQLFMDIKPGACPNPLESRARGVIPISVLGTADFDVRTVDVASLRLFRADGVGGAVVPTISTLDDTGTPFQGSLCGCHGLGRDQIMDLSMKFDLPETVRVLRLETVALGVSVRLVVSGALSDGCKFMASDCIERTPVHGQ